MLGNMAQKTQTPVMVMLLATLSAVVLPAPWNFLDIGAGWSLLPAGILVVAALMAALLLLIAWSLSSRPRTFLTVLLLVLLLFALLRSAHDLGWIVGAVSLLGIVGLTVCNAAGARRRNVSHAGVTATGLAIGALLVLLAPLWLISMGVGEAIFDPMRTEEVYVREVSPN